MVAGTNVRVRRLSGEIALQRKCSLQDFPHDLLQYVPKVDMDDDPFSRTQLFFHDQVIDKSVVFDDLDTHPESDCIDLQLVRSLHTIRACVYVKYAPAFKFFITGAPSAGKSTLLQRYCDGTWQNGTHGKDFGTKSIIVNGCERVNLQISVVRQKVVAGADAVLVLFDLADRHSFEMVVRRFSDYKSYGRNDGIIVLVGSKVDVNDARRTSVDEAQDFAKKQRMHYFEVSSWRDVNVSAPFHALVCSLLERQVLPISASRSGCFSCLMS
jgi:hypothetical protein|mmetsp:Transcript_105998/g.167358  ORF Transcript_105998/g.167358 Transcript_105998/m.167358 type:complete len:269 (+) Transcript_105998:41-847(+)